MTRATVPQSARLGHQNKSAFIAVLGATSLKFDGDNVKITAANCPFFPKCSVVQHHGLVLTWFTKWGPELILGVLKKKTTVLKRHIEVV